MIRWNDTVRAWFMPRVDLGIQFLLRNIWGAIIGATAGYFLSKTYISGRLTPTIADPLSRSFEVLGMNGMEIATITLIILISAYLGAFLFGGKKP